MARNVRSSTTQILTCIISYSLANHSLYLISGIYSKYYFHLPLFIASRSWERYSCKHTGVIYENIHPQNNRSPRGDNSEVVSGLVLEQKSRK
jgi:hypothetical protein